MVGWRYNIRNIRLSCERPHSLDALKKKIRQIKKGDSIHLKILRGGEVIE